MSLHVYTDGSALGNPGPGGWSVILTSDKFYKELGGSAPHATNNQMELQAAIEACLYIRTLPEITTPIHVHADSQYVVKGLTLWLPNWEKNNWRTASKKPVENQEYWRALKEASAGLPLVWEYIEGHAGHEHNERCDEIARNLAAGKSVVLKDFLR